MGQPRRVSTQSVQWARTQAPLTGNDIRDNAQPMTAEDFGLTVIRGKDAPGYTSSEYRKGDSFTSPMSDWVARAEWHESGSRFGVGNAPCVIVTFKDKDDIETVSCLYSGFTRYQWRLFLAAASKGKWVHRNLYGKPYVDVTGKV